jgi:membrane-associated protease RseP (regulator of RpoE activity)
LEPVRDEPGFSPAADIYWRPRKKFQDRVWLHVLLLVLTLVTTMITGVQYYGSFISGLGTHPITGVSDGALFLGGAWFSIAVLAILGAHELGHYFACRYYDVDASLPFFLPMLFVPSGTLGAVIRIREPIPSKRMLFDIGIAGPIAGFVIAVPALLAGLWLSNVVAYQRHGGGLEFGEPLLFQALSWLFWGVPPEGYALNTHPLAFAAWFGLLVTSLNLFPVGQLDGGHISYAVLGRASSTVTLVMIGVLVLLSTIAPNWIVWTILMIAMLFVFGRHHPRTFDEDVSLDRRRKWLALFAVVMFVLSFTPVPIKVL